MRDADSDTRKIAPRGIEPGGSGREGLDRYLLLCSIAYAAACFMALSWAGVL